MKSITIHNLDSKTAELIEKKAKESGLSLNKTIKSLLRKALGISELHPDHSEDFREFLGVWSESDFHDFERNTEDFQKIGEADWQ